MEEGLFKNKYRIKSIRHREWDYSQEGFYFATICAENREIFFGNIIDGKIILSPVGKIIKEEWLKTEKIRKNVKLDQFVVMPDHIHGIIVIVETHCHASLPSRNQNFANPVETHCYASPSHASPSRPDNFANPETHCYASPSHASPSRPDNFANPETHGNASLPSGCKNKFGSQSNNLSAIIRGFKGVTTKIIHQNFPEIDFVWQARFYDRIIRNEKELNKIREYIINNPLRWELDKSNEENFLCTY